MLVKFENLRRICLAFYSHLGGMNQAVLLYAYVYKCAEGSDVRNDALKFHSCPQIFNSLDVMSELELLRCLTRIASRLTQLGYDIIDGRKTEITINL